MIQRIGKYGGRVGGLRFQDGYDYYMFKLTKDNGLDLELCRRTSDSIYPIRFVLTGLLDFEVQVNYNWWFAVDSGSPFTRDRRIFEFGDILNFGEVTYSGCTPDFSRFQKVHSISTTSTSGVGAGRIAQFDGMGCAGQSVVKQINGILKVLPESLSGFGSGAVGESFRITKMNS